jgi:hypothetical protein
MTQRRNTTKKCVDLVTVDVEWFENTYPRGSFSWILSMLLSEFRIAMEKSPQDYAKIGAQAMREMLENGGQIEEAEDSGS